MKTLFTFLLLSICTITFGQNKPDPKFGQADSVQGKGKLELFTATKKQNKFKKQFAKADSAFNAKDLIPEIKSNPKPDSIVLTDYAKQRFIAYSNASNQIDQQYQAAKQELQQKQNGDIDLILDQNKVKFDEIEPGSVRFDGTKIYFTRKKK